MNWQEACEHPSLRNLPFKIELNEFGKIVMAPVRVNHSIYQAEIAHLMMLMCSDGKAMVECAIHTCMGTKAADVAWAARERFEQIRHEVECSIAPEVCVEVFVEVFSPGNTAQEMREKQGLYFEAGAEEVWYCDEDGRLSFFDAEGPLATSRLFPEFPQNIEL